ncbi:PLP-dependent aminotransferase family protein [Pararhizobium sp. YC-54]|uniref:aminotransferase-like domain-containing protein n=1 Tax=Pararhizobium sp. YC-54 TaxID=2986920 RepID=UPI0021F6F7F5|nr:PLP-dependent aminotransferase family protein [Pararhizobium sp. YC-54]MCW0002153.1 PLP-dependent aminotransferase family protein [Pararhizobium sp. YC-54]
MTDFESVSAVWWIVLSILFMKRDNRLSIVIQSLRDVVASGRPGTRLPSVRTLIKDHRVSPATVERAFAQLVGEGLIEPRPGQGTFVRQTMASATDVSNFAWQSVALGAARADSGFLGSLLAVPPPESLILSMGYLPPDLQASGLLANALRQAAGRPELWDRLPIEGLEPLRAWFAREVGNGAVFSPHDVIICGGGQAAISTTFRALVPPGRPVLVETPTYTGAISAACAAGLELVPVAMDEQGVRPELLADAFRQTGARVFYSQPTFSNPSGIVLSAERRAVVLNIAAEARAFIIEDDWARDLDLTGTAPAPLAAGDRHGHVVYIRSLAKSAAPGLRVAAVMARGAALARLKSARGSDDFFVSGPLQAAALAVVSAPGWKRHLNAARAALIERRDALVGALHAELGNRVTFQVPSGGMHLWLRLPDHVSDVALAADMVRHGVIVSAGCAWFPADPDGSFLRLTFAAPPASLREGVRRLGQVISLGI